MQPPGTMKRLALRIFSRLARDYDSVLLWATIFQDRYWKRELLAMALVERTADILDLGSGTGVLEGSLEKYGSNVVGLDLTKEMVEVARRKELPHVTGFLVGDAEHVPFKDSSFDLVLSCYLAKYCDLKVMLCEVARVLRPGGCFVLYDFSRPGGPFALFHAFYLYGALRLAGKLLRRTDPALGFILYALPPVIGSRHWDEALPGLLNENGFHGVGSKRLTGGVVTLFWSTMTWKGNPS